MPWPLPSWPKILFIDDAPATLELITRDLYKDEIQPVVARSLEEGLAIALRILPDLIVVDYKFNGETGIEFGKRLKAEPKLADIPRILMTEREIEPELRKRALAEGYIACVNKPIFDASWMTLVRSFVKRTE